MINKPVDCFPSISKRLARTLADPAARDGELRLRAFLEALDR